MVIPFKLTFTESVAEHPLASVPTTVYVVTTVGVAIGLAMFAFDKELLGVHTKFCAPIAFKDALPPTQILMLFPASTIGKLLTVTVTVSVDVHPGAEVIVTV